MPDYDDPSDDPLPHWQDRLRAHGLRVTPQRRAILAAFEGGRTEHLSADEVHARASLAVPELSRATVYATLAELAELGLLGAVGSPEPVRYEIHSDPHGHFRCRLCLRLFDCHLTPPSSQPLSRTGFSVEASTVLVDGICADCAAYEDGLSEGVRWIHTARALAEFPSGLACGEFSSPVGELVLAATSDGLTRVAFEDHADVPALRQRMTSRHGGRAARAQLSDAQAVLAAYFARDPVLPICQVDWSAIDPSMTSTLRATQQIAAGQECSYQDLATDSSASERGQALGANPLAIVVPCHRVTRGREIPGIYLGGIERKTYLRRLERAGV